MKILVIGDRLSKQEEKDNLGPWAGRYAQWMRGLLRSKGTVILRNISHTSQSPKDESSSRDRLFSFITTENPDLLFLCGPEVSSLAGCFPWINNLEKRRGQFDNIEGFLFNIKGVKTFPIPHPRDIYNQKHYYPHLLNTLEKAFLDQPELAPQGLFNGPIASYLEHLEAIKQTTSLVFDIETPMIKKGKLVPLGNMFLRGLGWATKEVCGAITPDQFGLEVFNGFKEAILAKIADPECLKINQNIFFDLEYLDYLEMKEGRRVTLRGPVHCTKQAEVLMNPDLPADLGAIAARNFILSAWKGDHHASGEALRFYNMKDVFITREIYYKQTKQLKQLLMWEFFSERRMRLYEHTFKMARDGMRIDVEKRTAQKGPVMKALEEPLADIMRICEGVSLPQPKNPKRTPKADKFTGKMFDGKPGEKKLLPKTLRVATARDEKNGLIKGGIYELTYEKVSKLNPNSTQQLKHVMQALNFPKVIIRQASTKKRVADSTGTDALQKILATKDLTDNQRLFLLSLIDYRTLGKALRAYYNNALDEDGFFRYYYDQDGAKATGRSSSRQTVRNSGGNSQNFPAREKNKVLKNYPFKNLIIPRTPAHIITQHDQSSAEAMIVAHLSGTKVLMEEFKRPTPDSHRLIAKFIHEYLEKTPFESLPSEDQKRLRNGRKAVAHGYNYGMAAPTLQETIFKNTKEFVPIKDIELVFTALDQLLPEIKTNWHFKMKQRIQSQAPWYNAFGRMIVFRGKEEQNTLNEMLAKEPQGTIPELTNEMLCFFGEVFRRWPEFGGSILQMCHDSLACCILEDTKDLYNALFTYRSQFISLDLGYGPFVVKWDGSWGPSLGEAKKPFTNNNTISIPQDMLEFAKQHALSYTRRTPNV